MTKREWKVGERCWFRFVDGFRSGKIERIDGDWAEIRIGWGLEWERLESLHPSKAKAQMAEAKFWVRHATLSLRSARRTAAVMVRDRERELDRAKKRLAALKGRRK